MTGLFIYELLLDESTAMDERVQSRSDKVFVTHSH